MEMKEAKTILNKYGYTPAQFNDGSFVVSRGENLYEYEKCTVLDMTIAVLDIIIASAENYGYEKCEKEIKKYFKESLNEIPT